MATTTQQGVKDDQRRQQQVFQRCHLQILRSLYNEDGGSISSEKGIDDNEQDNTDGNTTADKVINSEEEGPVSSQIWELIDRFLQQRREYLPQLQRQIHWNEIFAEASSRRDHLISISSEKQHHHQQASSLSRAPSLTPRNLAFSAVKRRSLSTTPNNHINLSLTPLTNNRNAMTSRINNDELSEVSIPAWNFISRIVKQRQDGCTKMCDSFRSEPFLQSLLDEAKERCKVLEVSLQAFKNEMAANINHNGKKRGSSTTLSSPVAKRVKFDNSRKKCDTGISFFKRSEPLPETIDPNESNDIKYSDSMMQNQIKLNLWSSLSNSVEKIIGVGKK